MIIFCYKHNWRRAIVFLVLLVERNPNKICSFSFEKIIDHKGKNNDRFYLQTGGSLCCVWHCVLEHPGHLFAQYFEGMHVDNIKVLPYLLNGYQIIFCRVIQ